MPDAQLAEVHDAERVASRLAKLRIEPPPAAEPAPSRRPVWQWAAIAVALFLLGAFVAWLLAPASVAPSATAVQVSTATAEPPVAASPSPATAPDVPQPVILGGYVKARREIHLGAAVSGVIRAMYVEPGSRVVAGQRIAELANDTLKALVVQAQANAAAREAELAELRNGALPEEVARAEAQVAEARAAADQAERTLRRLSALASDGLVAAADLDGAREGRDIARAQLAAAERDLELIRAGPRPERIRAAEAALAEARAALGLAKAQVDQTVIRSPIDGVVTKQHAQVGELVSAGYGGGAAAAIVTIADTSRLIVEVDVPHAELHRVHLGESARVESEALAGETFSGRVSWIGPEANRQKLSVPIEIEIVGPVDGLLPGLSAKATFLAVQQSETPSAGAPARAADHPSQGGNQP